MNRAIFILLVLFLSCALLATKGNDSRDTFADLVFTKEEREAIEQPYDASKNKMYMRILNKYDLPISPLNKKNYCDVRGLFQKNCDVKLTYTNK